MLIVDNPAELDAHVGRELGPSDWITVDQGMIDRFAEATGDRQWIHVDVARAERELPTKSTIAHGYLTLSLLPVMIDQIYRVDNCSRRINYGANKLRFTNAVPAGARVRLRQKLVSVEPSGPPDGTGGTHGRRVVALSTVEIEGEERPALVAEIVSLVFP